MSTRPDSLSNVYCCHPPCLTQCWARGKQGRRVFTLQGDPSLLGSQEGHGSLALRWQSYRPTQVGSQVRAAAVGPTRRPGSPERPCVPGSARRTEADGKSYVKYQVIGKNHVAVPTHFFKVLILEAAGGQIELRSYVMPNAPVDEAVPLERFLVPIESIERASGLLFVPNILARAGSLKAVTAGSK